MTPLGGDVALPEVGRLHDVHVAVGDPPSVRTHGQLLREAEQGALANLPSARQLVVRGRRQQADDSNPLYPEEPAWRRQTCPSPAGWPNPHGTECVVPGTRAHYIVRVSAVNRANGGDQTERGGTALEEFRARESISIPARDGARRRLLLAVAGDRGPVRPAHDRAGRRADDDDRSRAGLDDDERAGHDDDERAGHDHDERARHDDERARRHDHDERTAPRHDHAGRARSRFPRRKAQRGRGARDTAGVRQLVGPPTRAGADAPDGHGHVCAAPFRVGRPRAPAGDGQRSAQGSSRG